MEKYLYYLNPESVEVEGLLLYEKVMCYIKDEEAMGVGCSGMLHMIDAHSLAVKYLLFTVKSEQLLRKGEKLLTFLTQARMSYKKEKKRKQTGRVEVRVLREEDDDLEGVQTFPQDESVSTFIYNVKELLEQGRGCGKKVYNLCLGIICAPLMYM